MNGWLRLSQPLERLTGDHLLLGLILLFVALDQGSKFLVRDLFSLHESYTLIDSWMSLTYIENPGAAFGIFAGNRWAFVVMTFLILGALFYFRHQIKYRPSSLEWATALITSGALGNLIDRVVKGTVTDFISIGPWPVFNIADIAVCLGVAFFAYYAFKYMEE